MPLSSYRAPIAKTSTTGKLGWLREARQESELYLQNQAGWSQLDEDIRIIQHHFPALYAGLQNNPQGTTTNNRIHVPQVKRMISEMSSILGNIEPSWSHTPSNDELRDVSEVLDKCTRTWWERTFAVEKIVECTQWSAANRTGYVFPVWNPHLHGINHGDIELRVGGPKDYLPLWPNKSHDIQQAYAGTIKVPMPITEFAATWPTLAESVYPDGEQPQSLLPRIIRGAQELFDPSDENKQYREGRVPTVTVYWTYIRDMSMNITGNTIPMGTPDTSWSYQVPAFGSDIPTGLVDVNTGNDLTKKARKEDTYLYPWLRLIIWTDSVVCYDGPSYWFHGRIPAVKLTLDPWPWSFLGGSMVRDIMSLEEANNRTIRSIDKREQLRPNPPRMVNESRLDNTTAESIQRLLDTPGALVKVEDFREEVLKSLTDPRDLQVDQWELEYYKGNKDEMQDIIGLNNLQRMAELRQMPSGDTAEKMLQITGARTQRKGNIMERFCSELAPMVDALIFQWYDTNFRWKLFGYKGMTVHDFDFDPGTLVPSEIPGRKGSSDRKFGDARSSLFDTRAKRARYLVSTMGVQIERGSLLDITSMTRQLMEMRLWQDPSFPKDPISLGESLRLSNMGTMDDGPDQDTRIGRAKKWARISTEAIAELQADAQRIMQGGTPEGQIGAAIQDIVKGAMGQGNGNGGSPIGGSREVGRPPVYKSSPQLDERTNPDGTTRTIIDTSREAH